MEMETAMQEQTAQDFTRKTAAVIGSTAAYLQSHDARQMLSDVEGVARRNPMPALIGAAAVGVLIGAFLRRG